MNAEIVTIGSELLLGEIEDTNATHIARQLLTIGLNLYYRSTVGDNLTRIAEVVSQALDRAEVVITTGGLGPTVDDVTREAVAQATERPLEFRQALLDQITDRFARWHSSMGENNRRQAFAPQGALAIENPVGTAPCFAVETERGVIISLPGVPREMQYLLKNEVLPYLRRRFQLEHIIKVRVLRTAGIGESNVDAAIADLEMAANPTVGLAAHAGQTDVRITAKAPSDTEADYLIAKVEAEIRQRLGEHIYGTEKDTIEEVLVHALSKAKMTLAVAEIGTGGRLAQRLKRVPGAELVLSSTHTDNASRLEAKLNLKDPESTAQAIASQLVSGPQAPPLGLVALILPRASSEQATSVEATIIALTTPTGIELQRFGFGGHAAHIAAWASTRAMDMLRRWLLKHGSRAEN